MQNIKFLVISFFFFFASNYPTSVFGQTCSKDTPCTTKACCSKWGNCGYGPDFCENGCLNACDTKPECGQYAEEGKKECPLKVCCSQFGFCGTTEDFCNDKCQSGCKAPSPKSCDSGRSLLNIGYYASWSSARKCQAFAVGNIDPRNYTHLNYAFGTISGGVMVEPSGDEATKMADFVGLKKINPDLKVLISVGGWAFNDPGPTRDEFHNIISSQDSRSKFINSVSDYLSNIGFDGIDIDYEYPGADDRGGHPEDTDNYLKLVEEMREKLGDKLITIAAPASYWYLRHFRIGDMSKSLDWINVMTYDIHGVWDKEIESLGPKVKSHTNITEIKDAIGLFLRDGVPADKIVLGLGLYGRSFKLKDSSCTEVGCEFSGPADAGKCTDAPGTLAWFEIEDIAAKEDVKPTFDQSSESMILVWGGNQWVAYDNDQTLSLKRDYASTSCFKGVMFWSIDQGLDRASGGLELMQLGNIANAIVEMSFDDNYDLFQIHSSQDARNGFLYVSLIAYGDIDPKESSVAASFAQNSVSNNQTRRKRQSGPNKPGMPSCSVIRNFVTVASFFVGLYQRMLYNIATGAGGGPVTAIRPNDRNNPIEVSFVRDIPSGAQRVEYIIARYAPRHLNLNNRVNFPPSGNTSTEYMRSHLDGMTTDERGHLVGNFGSGPPLWYNLVPQHRSVNRNYMSRWILNDWYNIEQRIQSHLVSGGEVQWQVAMSYVDSTTGRPYEFTYEAIFYDSQGNQVDSIFGSLHNCPPSDGIDTNGRCLGL